MRRLHCLGQTDCQGELFSEYSWGGDELPWGVNEVACFGFKAEILPGRLGQDAAERSKRTLPAVRDAHPELGKDRWGHLSTRIQLSNATADPPGNLLIRDNPQQGLVPFSPAGPGEFRRPLVYYPQRSRVAGKSSGGEQGRQRCSLLHISSPWTRQGDLGSQPSVSRGVSA